MNVLFKTSLGEFTIKLDEKKAPETVENFLSYVEDKFYDGTIFHRVINGFMVQGGGMDANMKERSTKSPIKNEADNGLKNDKGSIAMARTNDPHSATAQFFINVADNDFLNYSAPTTQGWGYAVFGKVVDGMDVITQMKGVETGRHGMHQDVPVEAIVIEEAAVVEEE